MANIHDIAKASGYSVGTVSRVLNHERYVSQKARDKVLATIHAFNYTPNRVARSLSSGQTRTFGLVVPDIEQPFYNALLRGAVMRAFHDQYRLLLLPSAYDESTELEYLELLREQTFDGLIFGSHQLSMNKISDYLPYGRIVICHDPKNSMIPAAYPHRGHSYREAFQWCLQQGHHEIGLILGRESSVSATTRETLAAYNDIIDRQPSNVVVNATKYSDGYAAGEYFLAHPSDAILASSDDVGAGLLDFFSDHHSKPPMVIGQDRQQVGHMLKMPTVDHHIEAVGRAAAEILITGVTQSECIESEFILGSQR